MNDTSQKALWSVYVCKYNKWPSMCCLQKAEGMLSERQEGFGPHNIASQQRCSIYHIELTEMVISGVKS